MTNSKRRGLRLAGVVPLAAACASSAVPVAESVQPAQVCDAVTLLAGPVWERPETLVVALTDSVHLAGAPRPRNDSERFLFRQMYETLVRVDCTGREYSHLATTWSTTAERVRTIQLRDDALFWDGSPVTTADVAASWEARGIALQTVASIASVSVLDDRSLTVSFPRMQAPAVMVLAEPVLAVTKRGASGWPTGSGRYRVVSVEYSAEGLELLLEPRVGVVSERVGPVRVRILPGADPRDLLDAGNVDVVISRDAAALAYARTLFDFRVSALPWDRAYVLLVPVAVDGKFAPSVSRNLRNAMAQEASRSEARPAESPFWWRTLATSCDVLLPEVSRAPERTPEQNRIVYAADDGDAKSLAERLVALSSGPSEGLVIQENPAATSEPATAIGLRATDFTRALRRGGDLAYVIRLPRLPMDPCSVLGRLIGQAPWLGSRAGLVSAVVPLIDTRARVVTRRGVLGLTIDGDGTLVLPVP